MRNHATKWQPFVTIPIDFKSMIISIKIPEAVEAEVAAAPARAPTSRRRRTTTRTAALLASVADDGPFRTWRTRMRTAAAWE